MADSIKKLIDIFSKFPTIGPRTAGRFVFYLMKLPKEKVDEIILSIQELKNKVKFCQLCFNPYEDTNNDLCNICSDPRREKSLLCIVEKEADLLSIESTKKYTGLYFILGGTIQTLKKEESNPPRFEDLKKRAKTGNFTEIILALNPTPEGKATSVLIERQLKDTSSTFKITHLAQGLPVGGELEYADEETLESAFDGRK